MTAAPHNHPTNSDLHRCECSAMADLLSLVLPSAYGAQSAAELGSRDYGNYHNRAHRPNRCTANHAGSPVLNSAQL